MTSPSRQPVTVDCKVVHRGERSIRIQTAREVPCAFGGKQPQECGIPLSMLIDEEQHKDGTSTITIPLWIAEKEGLDHDAA